MATVQTGIATDLITFSRTSNATVTDSDGLIKWAPHNLLLASEQFDSASWTKTSITPTANAVAAPNGTTTADTLTASGANGTTLQSYTSLGVSYTFGIWLKRKTGTGNIQIAADSGTYTTVTITSDWALYTVTQTPAAGTISAGIRIVTSADAVEAWGAHLYRSDLGGMKANTSAYPMYNPTTPKNLLGYTEDFSNVAWSKLNAGTGVLPVVTANYALAPNGLQVADRIQLDLGATTSTAYSRLFQAISPTLAKAVNSIYLKTNDGSTKTIYFGKSDGATFDLVTVTGEWQRFSAAPSTSSATGQIQFGLAGASSGVPVTTSTSADILAWGAQLSDSASLDTYAPNYGAAPTAAAYYGPRLDFDGSTLAAKGLLVEELRTNLQVRSEEFSSASWLSFSASVSADATIAPSGLTVADKITEVGSAGQSIYGTTTAPFSVVTASAYFKSSERTFAHMSVSGDGSAQWFAATFNLTTGVVSQQLAGASGTISGATIVPVGNSWYRCTVTGLTGASSGGTFFYVGPSTTGTPTPGSFGVLGYTGTTGSGVFIWGAQLEAGSFATSYIPTGAATATRNADVASVSTQAFPYSATEGTIVVASTTTVNNSTGIALSLTEGSSRISVASETAYQLYVYNAALSPPAQANLDGGTPSYTGGINKAASVYKNDDFALSFNGGTVATDTSGTVPSGMTTMFIGTLSSNSFVQNGHIRQITYIPRRLSNTELQTRSS